MEEVDPEFVYKTAIFSATTKQKKKRKKNNYSSMV